MIKLRLEIFLESQHNFDRNATNHISTSLVLLNAWTQRKLLQFDLYKVNEEFTLLSNSFKCHEKLSSHKWIALHQIF